MSSNIEVVKRGVSLGAEIRNVDLSQTLSDDDFQVIHDALLEHQIIKFHDQDITSVQQIAFGNRFGELTVHPFSPNASDTPELIVFDNKEGVKPFFTDVWHSDETFRAEPPMAT
ncbi:MAG: TauD/TfdA family dioxygenase, partial [Rhodospirillales bacterium]|nr:TauD/TfdA family dioxygenase [Rhodospirillales bacterium]